MEIIEVVIEIVCIIYIMHFCIKIGREYGTMEAFILKIMPVPPLRYKQPKTFREKVFFYFSVTTPYEPTDIEFTEGLIRGNKCLSDNPTYKTDIQKVLHYRMANNCSSTEAVNAIIPSFRNKNSIESLED